MGNPEWKESDRLYRVLVGLEEIYEQNAKAYPKLPAANDAALGVPGVRTLLGLDATTRTKKGKAADLRPKIEELLLKGLKPKEVMKQTGAKPSAVYGISSEFRKAGKLK